jgi:hypothetical protein
MKETAEVVKLADKMPLVADKLQTKGSWGWPLRHFLPRVCLHDGIG